AVAPEGCELPFVGGLIGLFSYDFGRPLENMPEQARPDIDLPLARSGPYPWALITAHQKRRSQLVFHPALTMSERERLVRLFYSPLSSTETSAPFTLLAPFAADLHKDDYRQAIERIQRYIQAGDCYQVNFAQRFRTAYAGDPWTAYQALRAACPTPYAGFIALEHGAVLSQSPERFLDRKSVV